MPEQKCGTCGNVFSTDEEYAAHTCSDGYAPTELKHQGKRGILAAKAALRRTGDLSAEKEEELDAEYAEVSSPKSV